MPYTLSTYVAPLLASERGGWRSRGITAESLEVARIARVSALRTASQIQARTWVVGAATRAPRAMDLEANILQGGGRERCREVLRMQRPMRARKLWSKNTDHVVYDVGTIAPRAAPARHSPDQPCAPRFCSLRNRCDRSTPVRSQK